MCTSFTNRGQLKSEHYTAVGIQESEYAHPTLVLQLSPFGQKGFLSSPRNACSANSGQLLQWNVPVAMERIGGFLALGGAT